MKMQQNFVQSQAPPPPPPPPAATAPAKKFEVVFGHGDNAKPKGKGKKPSKTDLKERFAKVAKLGAGSSNQVLTRLVVAYCV